MQMKQKPKRNGFKWMSSVVPLTLVLAILLAGCSNDGNSNTGNAGNTGANSAAATTDAGSNSEQDNSTDAGGAQEIKSGESLVIPVGDITETAAFYPIKVDGTTMEVLAVKAPDGTIRTAFNTCEVCYDSGRGYYKQEGNVLICQNCGNRFKTSQVEVQSSGCNPWPIFTKDKTVTDESITISYDFLSASTKAFENWKRSY
ncbi:hypothetical protein SDC9_131777 [bioreactor metagenome]|uniref:Membrane iron-sulfur containing protein FtrD-like domain-containing protein n=1 Tax=bioreactor metagenome TaxID=1076179 RepID=A0A645D5V8_9ZZZZ